MMVSNDNQILLLILNQLSNMKRDNASYYERTERQISDMRKENAEIRREVKQEIQDFKAEMKQEMTVIQEQIAVMQSDITGLKHDVAGLYHWDYWLLSIILVVFAMPQIVAGIKSLFGALAEGISLIVGAFRKDNK